MGNCPEPANAPECVSVYMWVLCVCVCVGLYLGESICQTVSASVQIYIYCVYMCFKKCPGCPLCFSIG